MDTNEIEVKFLDKIRKNSNSKHISGKFFIGFSIVFLIALVLGIAFCRITGATISDAMKIQLASHFTEVFDGCTNATDYFTVIITASSADFRYLVLIFAAGFTYFCKYASAVMIGVRAFTLGYCSEFLMNVIKQELIYLKFPSLSFTLFLISELLILALIIYLSVKATFFGDDFRRLRGRRSLMLRSPVIYKYIFLFLTALGLVIIINAGYCSISSMI